MARNVYVASVEGHTGKSTVALGLLDALRGRYERVGVFRPVARTVAEPDHVVELLRSVASVSIPYDDCIGVTYADVHANPDGALATIIERFKSLESQCDAVVILGSDYTDVGSPTELEFNARIAANLASPVLLVINGRQAYTADQHLGQVAARTPHDIAQVAELTMEEIRHSHAVLLGVVVNRAESGTAEEIVAALSSVVGSQPVWIVDEDSALVAPRMTDLAATVDGDLLFGPIEALHNEALGVVVCAMNHTHSLERIFEGAVLIIPSDRTEVLLAVLMAEQASGFPSIAGIVLNGGFELPDVIRRLLDGAAPRVPIVSSRYGTFETTTRVTSARGRVAASDSEKIARARAVFSARVPADQLMERVENISSTVMTPLMFRYSLLQRARTQLRRIVLPEGSDDRILAAAADVLREGAAGLVILGDEKDVRARASRMNLLLDGAQVVSPTDPELVERFAIEYANLRSHKGMTLEHARLVVRDPSYFGTMMVHLGLADGMVSGAIHTTADTIRPAFEIIKTTDGTSVVSSVFLMALADRVLVYGDCAVIPNPTSEQLTDIAISSATTASAFGIEPRVAMLSYSTGDSGSGNDVEKVREATRLVHERRPDLAVDGPIQYDAAVDAAVARTKLPDSDVAGRATVFVFPDLNTGNNTYKAVQRSAGAVAIGPILQGLRKPVNDLSRGAQVDDIVNTIVMTAIQAQGTAGGAT